MEDTELRTIIQGVLQENPTIVENMRRGKAGGGGFLLGRTLMKLPREDVRDPQHIYAIILDELARVSWAS
jgi:Asp-tRNA(Asn)/Glu-tRNA(Gln) amidotransferase B subunit